MQRRAKMLSHCFTDSTTYKGGRLDFSALAMVKYLALNEGPVLQVREEDHHSIESGFQLDGSEDRLATTYKSTLLPSTARQLDAFRAVARTTRICSHAGGRVSSSFWRVSSLTQRVIFMSNNRRAREAMWFARFGTIHSRTTALCGSKIIKSTFRQRNKQKLSFLERIAGERCKRSNASS